MLLAFDWPQTYRILRGGCRENDFDFFRKFRFWGVHFFAHFFKVFWAPWEKLGSIGVQKLLQILCAFEWAYLFKILTGRFREIGQRKRLWKFRFWGSTFCTFFKVFWAPWEKLGFAACRKPAVILCGIEWTHFFQIPTCCFWDTG